MLEAGLKTETGVLIMATTGTTDKSEKWLVRRRSTECEEFVEREEMVAHIVCEYKKLG